mmetsp:Transcript_3347/g.6995  ORF Transcript_3347/g.6995 Transcript_3347/m.6995 type:complete len:255 (+) Transcript_3347:137-901(+)
MGNETSSSVEEKKESTNDDATTTTPSTPSTTFGSNQSNNMVSPKTSSSRRIIKAVKPDASTLTPVQLLETDNNNDNDIDDNVGNANKKHSLPLPIAESPSVARELELEKMEQQKQGRLEEMKSSQRAKRDKRLDERRKKHGTQHQNFLSAGNGNDETTSSGVQANPFSRFLSAFSVQPAHPEHKRPYPQGSSESFDGMEPTVKKPRSEKDNGDNVDGLASSKFSWTGNNHLAMAGSVVAVVAVAVGFWLRAAKR